MPSRDDFFTDFYNEAMTEMAQNFFSRRKEMEARLEGFNALAADVRKAAGKVMRKFGCFFALAVDTCAAEAFLQRAGVTLPDLAGRAHAAGQPWPVKLPFAFTADGRHEKTLRKAYQALYEAVQDYREGAYGPDPRDPRRKILLPNYQTLHDLAQTINAEVDNVNNAQTPSTVLGYAKSLDPVAAGRESITGGMTGEDVLKIDRDMAFAHIDFDSLDIPDIPQPLPLEQVQGELDALGLAARKNQPREVRQAMSQVAMQNG